MSKATAQRPGDDQHREQVTALYLDHGDRIRQLVFNALRPEDRHLADDLAQDVWLTLWTCTLRGDTIARPAGLLSTMARHRVSAHYRAARTRYEQAVDYSDRTNDRLAPMSPSAEAEVLAVEVVRQLAAVEQRWGLADVVELVPVESGKAAAA